jgi:hypothetical protein
MAVITRRPPRATNASIDSCVAVSATNIAGAISTEYEDRSLCGCTKSTRTPASQSDRYQASTSWR